MFPCATDPLYTWLQFEARSHGIHPRSTGHRWEDSQTKSEAALLPAFLIDIESNSQSLNSSQAPESSLSRTGCAAPVSEPRQACSLLSEPSDGLEVLPLSHL